MGALMSVGTVRQHVRSVGSVTDAAPLTNPGLAGGGPGFGLVLLGC